MKNIPVRGGDELVLQNATPIMVMSGPRNVVLATIPAGRYRVTEGTGITLEKVQESVQSFGRVADRM